MERTNVMRCMFCHAGWGGWGGGREAEPVDYEVQSLNGGLTLLSMAKACDSSGIPVGQIGDDPNDLMRVLLEHGVELARGEQQAALLGQVVIGWAVTPDDPKGQTEKSALCRDVAITAAILARTVGGIYFASREPDYRLSHLLREELIIDEHIPDGGQVQEEEL